MNKILVTGGAGYIGSFMVEKLLKDGVDVVVVDSLVRGNSDAIADGARLYTGDVGDRDFLTQVFANEKGIEGIIHFAGYISMKESMDSPGIYFQNNLAAGITLLDVAVAHECKGFLFSSTAGVYGTPSVVPIPEDHPKSPENPYGHSKWMFEQVMSWYTKIYGLPTFALRYFNASGASLDGTNGERHEPESHIIPMICKAIREKTPFTLYGTDYDTPDGTCIRDYIHVYDLAEAHSRALAYLLRSGGHMACNVGTGKGYSNREIIRALEEISASTLSIAESSRRPGDASILVADISRAKELLGFTPKYSDIHTIIETAWKWDVYSHR
jgi:UDP-glucose 4-epimerase